MFRVKFEILSNIIMIIIGILMILCSLLCLMKADKNKSKKNNKKILIFGTLMVIGFSISLIWCFVDKTQSYDSLKWENVKDNLYQAEVNENEIFNITLDTNSGFDSSALSEKNMQNIFFINGYKVEEVKLSANKKRKVLYILDKFSNQNIINCSHFIFSDLIMRKNILYQETYFLSLSDDENFDIYDTYLKIEKKLTTNQNRE